MTIIQTVQCTGYMIRLDSGTLRFDTDLIRKFSDLIQESRTLVTNRNSPNAT